MATTRDYYVILEISREASEDEVKKAYRAKAMQYHPDRNPGDASAEEKFKEATEAYEVLKDPQKREIYNRYGHEGLRQSAGAGGFGGGFAGFDLSDALRAFMRDFGGFGGFGDIFGGFGESRGRGGRRAPRGKNLQVDLKLTMEEIAEGVEKKIKIKYKNSCPKCAGLGAANDSGIKTCPHCKGSGEVQRLTQSLFTQMVRIEPCDYCNGEGKIITDFCPDCNGSGLIDDTKTIAVNIPAGVATGNYISMKNQGNFGPRGGVQGDIIIMITEKEHEHFTRQGDDVILEVPISFSQAALGTKIEIPTLNGNQDLSIPSGTQSGKLFRLRNKGIRRLRGMGRGDQIIRVTVWTPTKLDGDTKKLFEKLAGHEKINPPKPSKSFFDKLRDSLGL